MSAEYTDRFSDSTRELQEKSGFVCESCKSTYTRSQAIKQDLECCHRTLKELLEESFGP